MENKTYYDWLEVSRKASPEVIEKAYKALVKKYHPDLQQGNNNNSEELIKTINEAYTILSDEAKRAEYDAMLIAKEQKNKQILNQPQSQNNNYYSSNTISKINQEELEIDYQKQVEAAKQQAYHDAYIDDMRNRGYKIRYKKSLKDYFKIFIIALTTFILVWLIWQIPFIRNWINNLAESNFIIKLIVDIIKSIYEALYETLI